MHQRTDRVIAARVNRQGGHGLWFWFGGFSGQQCVGIEVAPLLRFRVPATRAVHVPSSSFSVAAPLRRRGVGG